MSLKKKDPSMRVAANDPHLVSLGGGRLSTAVTIHYIPIGDTSIGSSPSCSISLNGSGVHLFHCTIYRSEQNEVTIVPENDGRILIDGNKITSETNLTQGAMITIGNSNYLRFNNPAEAKLIRSTMGSNERISMPQIDFTQEQSNSNRNSAINENGKNNSVDEFYEKNINPKYHSENSFTARTKIDNICLNNVHSPKVFTADSITVNTPAKDVLGPKYASFTKNFIENHKNDKNLNGFVKNESRGGSSSYGNISTNYTKIYSSSCEMLTKVNNVPVRNQQLSTAYDRYPKPGTYGGLQLFPMNGVNSEINVSQSSLEKASNFNESQIQNQSNNSNISFKDDERLEELLKICTEYDRQHQNITSSPIVQNRIKTNGSLPREKKSPFYDLSPQSTTHNNKIFFPEKNIKSNSSGYENVRIIGDRRIEIGSVGSPKNSSGYENVIAGKYVPQSPRTKIRTTCMSPKKDSFILQQSNKHPSKNQSKEYAQLIQSFEDKMRMEMLAVNKNVKGGFNDETKQARKKNINNLTLNLRKPVDVPSSNQPMINVNGSDINSMDKLIKNRSEILENIRNLKAQISEIQCQEMEVQREMDMEKSLVSAEHLSVSKSIEEIEKQIVTLKSKIHRMEAQRNANRVMQENQQSKLRQSIDVKQDRKEKLVSLVRANLSDKQLKEKLENCEESLENDIKTFEDLEFQYLEEETDWLGYRDELLNELKLLSSNVDEKRVQLKNLEAQGIENQHIASNDSKSLERHLHSLFATLEKNRDKLSKIDENIKKNDDCNQTDSENSEDEDNKRTKNKPIASIMSQSLFGSTEILCPKRPTEDLMSKSVNENMFYNNNIESSLHATSTPKKSIQIIDIVHDDSTRSDSKSRDYEITPEVVRRKHNAENDPLLKLKYNVDYQERVNFNLSLGSDDFEVNPLEKRIPSQDDIDRICKVTSDAPISTKGASSKIYDSIMEIERNRQLLLAQQGSHVIEHERQKILELKKKSHDEARAQYLSQLSDCSEPDTKDQYIRSSSMQENYQLTNKENQLEDRNELTENKKHPQHRFSQPDLESQRTRPLSEANSEMSSDVLSQNISKSNLELTPKSLSTVADEKTHENSNRSSVNSGETNSESKTSGSKRSLPKHQRPLTRYLPIFSPDLDLKLHIESAGHQIQLCPHVIVDASSCRGYLHKLGATFHGWSRRWFVLDRKTSTFVYYSDKSEKKARGGAYFSTIDEVYLDHLNASKSGRPHCTFIVKTKKRSYHLQAASDAATRIWIDAIITGAQGNLDY